MRLPVLFLSALLVLGLEPALAAGLPDTGQNTCDNNNTPGVHQLGPCLEGNVGDAAVYPGQDARFGADAKASVGTLVKVGAGSAGFDYTKVSYLGDDLPASATQGSLATDWACTRDNVTGLLWEIKTAPAGTFANQWHAADNAYLWYNSNGSINGGNWGCPAGSCEAGVALSCHTAVAGHCRTEYFAQEVNNTSALPVCGYRDWRVPTRRELLTLVNAGWHSPGTPSIDSNYFPYVSGTYWTDTSAVADNGQAWAVNFDNGATGFYSKSSPLRVMLVRGAAF